MQSHPESDHFQTPPSTPEGGIRFQMDAPKDCCVPTPEMINNVIVLDGSLPNNVKIHIEMDRRMHPLELRIKGCVGDNVHIVSPYAITVGGSVGKHSTIQSTRLGDVCIVGAVGASATVIASRGKVTAAKALRNAKIIARAGECIVGECEPGASVESNQQFSAKRTLFAEIDQSRFFRSSAERSQEKGQHEESDLAQSWSSDRASAL